MNISLFITSYFTFLLIISSLPINPIKEEDNHFVDNLSIEEPVRPVIDTPKVEPIITPVAPIIKDEPVVEPPVKVVEPTKIEIPKETITPVEPIIKEEEPKLQIVDEDSNSRIIAVMINNNHAAWPHAGLQDAFLNYEAKVVRWSERNKDSNLQLFAAS